MHKLTEHNGHKDGSPVVVDLDEHVILLRPCPLTIIAGKEINQKDGKEYDKTESIVGSELLLSTGHTIRVHESIDELGKE